MDDLQAYTASVFMAKKYKNALELGSGYGTFTAFLNTLAKTDGVDISKTYVERARKLHNTIKFYVGDVTNLKLKRKYDVVVTHGLFIHIEHEKVEKAIKSMFRHGKELLLIESSGVEYNTRVNTQKYNAKKYWEHRARFPKEEDDLPMQYYYSHDYKKIFKKLGLRFQMVHEFDVATKTRMYLVCKQK